MLDQPRLRLGTALLLGALLLSGCAQRTAQSPARVVSLGEFADRSNTQATAEGLDAAQRAEIVARVLAGDESQDIEQLISSPAATGEADESTPAPPADRFADLSERVRIAPTKPGDRVVVDSKVGEINGRAIYADEFLEPMEHRLIEIARDFVGRERVVRFHTAISKQVSELVINELVLSDAESRLTQEEKLGLFAYVRSLTEQDRREIGAGSREEANRVLREQGEGDLDDLSRERRNELLVWQVRREKIEPRVVVSWHDVEREYRRRSARYNPPVKITLTFVRLRTEGNEELIAQISQRLTAGDDFEAVATELTGKAPRPLSDDPFTLGPGGMAALELDQAVTSQLAGLGEGDTTAGFEFNTSTMWVHVFKVDRPKGRSIYDKEVQQELLSSLRARRSSEAWQGYVRSLMQESIKEEMDDMTTRLVAIALDRYGR